MAAEMNVKIKALPTPIQRRVPREGPSAPRARPPCASTACWNRSAGVSTMIRAVATAMITRATTQGQLPIAQPDRLGAAILDRHRLDLVPLGQQRVGCGRARVSENLGDEEVVM